MAQTGKNTNPSIWDKKADQYNRFSHDKDTFQQKILEKIAQRGISFKGKTVLDIGCGTGVYTLHIAKEAKHVHALDFSAGMLDVLKQDAKAEGLFEKFSFTCNTWSGFDETLLFDIVFSSMSPAFASDADFEKMHRCAKTYCVYLGWGGKRESSLLDPIFKAHGKALNVPEGSSKLKNWLISQNIPFECEYIEEISLHAKSYEAALSSVLWHFEINQHTANKPLIERLLKAMRNDENAVEIQTTVGVELISWKK